MFDSKEICKINTPSPDSINGLVLQILAEMVTKDSVELISSLKQIVGNSREIHISTVVSEICNIASIPTSEESGFDGIDMLAKEITTYQCGKMIDIFKKVMKRQLNDKTFNLERHKEISSS